MPAEKKKGKEKAFILIKENSIHIIYCTCINALKLLMGYKLIERNYVHAGQAETHLLPRVHLDLLVFPVHSPWHSLSLATYTPTKENYTVFTKGLIN